ncbi:MAG: DNA internalization-related competence protein ComEC/Rec2 [Comamonas sp.]|uniref:DNA internalization-related competence protein ComEC/Rec2 n=1 Tax=Comamonas sp. TaxID=34028 RepID=UPI0026485E75|nr:DNA internalization-related competence protein ComEC/Rec2 [Comamonas sp.]MDN5503313.1 DNA internalization-related competence protein ComEC/Rec2 [Comamonas sp.]MDN5538091.1 DNA internalization-related competence protein ComEC/Rec2 [Comamonas sp.]
MPLHQTPSSQRRRLSWLAPLWGCVVGAAWQVTQARLWHLSLYQILLALGLLTLLLACRWRGRPWQGWWLLLTGAACCVAGLTGWRAHAYLEQTLPQALEAVDLQVEGRIASMLHNQVNGQRWRFVVDSSDAGVPRLLELSWYGPFGQVPDANQPLVPDWAKGVALSPGQRWRLTVRIKRPHGSRNQHGFDYELLAWEQGVQATGYVRKQPAPELLAVTSQYPLQRWRQGLRDRIQGEALRLQRWWPGGGAEHAQAAVGVVAALAVGDQQAIDRKDWTLFRQTGVAHLMSISGLHITMFAWLAVLIVGRAWRLSARACRWMPAPRAALVMGVLLAAAYALFSGWGLPAQRTICMLAVVALLQWLGVRWPWACVWLLALAVIVVADPWALWQAGFWLSFVAVGVLLASNSVADRAEAASAKRRFLARLKELWREQWLISLALAPLGLLLFGQVSVVGLLANLLAIPWVTWVVTPLALLAAVLPMAASAAAVAMLPLMSLLQWLAALPGAVWALPQPAWWASVLAIAAGLLVIAPLPGRLRLVAALLALPALFWPQARPRVGEFELLAADIGQGNAVIISTASHRLLYDAGPQYSRHSDAGERVLLPLMAANGMQMDAMMLSHSDMDHTGGALAVMAAQPRAKVWGSDSVIQAPQLAGLAPVQRCTQGQHWQWDGVTFEVLHPPAGEAWLDGRKAKPNFGSCVLRLRSASGRVALLAGDIEAAQERQLLQTSLDEPVDWLLVPHHGSKTSSTESWVSTLRPRWAVVQAGYRNRFGHPVTAVVQRYQAVGSQLVAQDRCGAAYWSSAQPEKLECERLIRAHYWDVHAVSRDLP